MNLENYECEGQITLQEYTNQYNGLNILVACEESQGVTKELRRLGHRAFSCDLQECSGGHPEWHIVGDVLKLLDGRCEFKTQSGQTDRQKDRWDIIIAHPPCTYLTNAATRHYSLRVTPAEKVAKRWQNRAESAVFFMKFVCADCDRIAIENPIGFMNSAYRAPDQIIQPYYFAESEQDTENYQMKTTCLWLKGLPKLNRTKYLEKPKPASVIQREHGKVKNVYFSENHGKIGDSKHRGNDAAARSKTFSGVAKAMAEQWAGNANN